MTNAKSLFLTFLIVGPLVAYFVLIEPAKNRAPKTEPAADVSPATATAPAVETAPAGAAPPAAPAVPSPAESTKETVPSVDPAAAEAAHYLDYSKPFPWFPAPVASLAPEHLAAMEKFRAIPSYNPLPLVPKKSGATAAQLDELERSVEETLALKVDAATGAVTGRALNYTGDRGPHEPDKTKPANFITDFYPLFDGAFRAYEASLPAKKGAPDDDETKAVRARAATLLNRLLTHFSNQPWDGIRSGGKIFDPGYGYIWRNDGGKGRRMMSAMQSLVDAPAVRANILENLVWMQGGLGTQKLKGFSMDEYGNNAGQYMAAISSMRDSPAKWQRMIMARYALENGILRASQGGTVTPDGGIIHHGYVHNNYASYEFVPMCQLLRALNDCGIPSICDADEVARRIARAGTAWSWYHQPNKIVTNMEGRPCPSFVDKGKDVAKYGNADHALNAALTLLSYKRPATWREDATRLLAIALVKNPDAKIPAELEPLLNEAKAIPAPISGAVALPSAGAVFQRRDDWLVSVRGGPVNRTAGEGMAYESWGHSISLGGLYYKGSVMLVADGVKPGAPPDLVSSGQAADGRDFSLMPGVTAPMLSWDKLPQA